MTDRAARHQHAFATLICTLAVATLMSACAKEPVAALPPLPAGVTRVAVAIADGHATEQVDRGRPVVLIAGALGVTPAVFRDAFSKVTPAHGRGPSEAEARANKKILIDKLGPHGITNERLDTVSNYYRYRPEGGGLWPVRPARVYALVKDGAISGFEIIDGGAGYSSTPTLTIPGHPKATAAVSLAYGADFKANGSITKVDLK